MDIDQPNNGSFVDFGGGMQLLPGGGARAALPALLVSICVSGAVGNLLVLLVFHRDFRRARGSEVKALLAAAACADLVLLLLCGPVRAVAYHRRSWTLGGFACSTADWLQHACVVAKTLILAATSHAKTEPLAVAVPGGGGGGVRATWIPPALALIWTVAALLPLPLLLFASLQPHGADGDAYVCVSETPACATDFMGLFYKIYPALGFALPIAFTLARYVKALHTAVNMHAATSASGSSSSGKVTLVLLCATGANALLLLPEWSAFTWTRLGHNRPPVGLAVFAADLVYSSGCRAAHHLNEHVRRRACGRRGALVRLHVPGAGRRVAKRNIKQVSRNEENGAEAGAHA
ncbi:hypothetical protein CRUP_016400 [Coryphaenoides rupestris]|nr:hypothetical protein CRUP_016400 [Coryphaenoides rupestris]